MSNKVVCIFDTELTPENLRLLLDELVMRPTGFINSMEIFSEKNGMNIESRTEVMQTPIVDPGLACTLSGGG